MRVFLRAAAVAALIGLGACAQAAESSPEMLFKRLNALEPAGNPDVLYNLGMFLNNGLGTRKDHKAAFRLFQRAAESGSVLASFKVGCYYAGQFEGVVPVDADLALKHKLRAAQAGYDLAQLDVGLRLAKTGDVAQALDWWERSSRQGSLAATAYLAQHYAADGSPDPVKGLALMQLLKDGLPQPSAELLARIAAVEGALTSEQKAAAGALRAGWAAEPTALTRQARAGSTVVPALLASLETKEK